MKRLTKEQKDFIKQNYSIMKTNDMCRELNLTYQQITNYASNLKLKKEAYYSKSYNNFWEECLEIHNNKYNIYKYLGNKKEPKIEENCLYKSKYGKYQVNQDYFEKIDNEWKAYWLGFLYADGCVKIKRNNNKNGKMEYQTSISLSVIDKQHIEKFKKSIQSNAMIHDSTTKLKDKNFNYSRFLVCNKKFCEDLNNLGCIPNKSLILKFPKENQVPKEFIRDFIRGYFDGDGCIRINLEKRNIQLSIMGTLEFLEELQNILVSELDITKTKLQRKKDNKAYSMQCGSIVSIQKIYNYLYKDCNIYLQRKLDKFNTLLWLD